MSFPLQCDAYYGRKPRKVEDEKPRGFTLARLREIYVTSFIASCCADVFVYPLDVTKTRLQIQGEHSNQMAMTGKYRGFLRTAMGVAKEEGFLKLYSGFSAVLVRHFFIAGFKMGLYDYLREKFSIVNEDGKRETPLVRTMLAGLISGAASTVLSNPFDLVKLQMQMESRRRFLGMPVRTTNVFQGLRQTYCKGGLLSLWRGFPPNVLRVSLYSMGGISFYDLSKRKTMEILQSPKETLLIQLIASMIAGFICSAISSPADVVKSRMMNQPVDEDGNPQRYKNTWDCFKRLVKDEGPTAMYKGFFPYWMRCGPWFLVFWMSFEIIRRLEGKEPF